MSRLSVVARRALRRSLLACEEDTAVRAGDLRALAGAKRPREEADDAHAQGLCAVWPDKVCGPATSKARRVNPYVHTVMCTALPGAEEGAMTAARRQPLMMTEGWCAPDHPTDPAQLAVLGVEPVPRKALMRAEAGAGRATMYTAARRVVDMAHGVLVLRDGPAPGDDIDFSPGFTRTNTVVVYCINGRWSGCVQQPDEVSERRPPYCVVYRPQVPKRHTMLERTKAENQFFDAVFTVRSWLRRHNIGVLGIVSDPVRPDEDRAHELLVRGWANAFVGHVLRY